MLISHPCVFGSTLKFKKLRKIPSSTLNEIELGNFIFSPSLVIPYVNTELLPRINTEVAL